MKSYIGIKLVNATPMTLGDYNRFRKWTLPANENGSDEGFLVEYVDGGKANTAEYEGYVSWSPAEVFENSYHLTQGMSFGYAVEAIKLGLKVARKSWNGKGMFIYYVPGNSYPAENNINSTIVGYFPGDMVPYQPYIAMKTAQDMVVPWAASQSDVLDVDWYVVA